MDFSYRVSNDYKTIVTNKIRCVHNSVGNNKFNIEKALTEKIYAWSFFIDQNISDAIKIQKFMLYSFFFLEALFISLLRRRLSIIKSWTATLNKIKNHDYSGSEFIDV